MMVLTIELLSLFLQILLSCVRTYSETQRRPLPPLPSLSWQEWHTHQWLFADKSIVLRRGRKIRRKKGGGGGMHDKWRWSEQKKAFSRKRGTAKKCLIFLGCSTNSFVPVFSTHFLLRFWWIFNPPPLCALAVRWELISQRQKCLQ